MPLSRIPLPASARYLFHQAGLDPENATLHEIAARSAGPILTLLRRWWTELEPEATAGVSASMMESALVAYAEEAVKKSDGSTSRRWARAWFNWKPSVLQTEVEQVIGERFLLTANRLGVLLAHGSRLSFAHPALLEMYLGLGFLQKNVFPPALTGTTVASSVPLMSPHGRAVLARLSLTPVEQRPAVLTDVARRSLILATWFLYCNDDARAAQGEWLGGQLLGALQWGQSGADRSSLESALASLGNAGLAACRTLIDMRQEGLPAHLSAITFVSQNGNADDLQRLRDLADEPRLGEWEIDHLRTMIREAEALVFDTDAQQRYTRQEIQEMAKDTAALILKIAGTVALKTSVPYPLGQETVVSVAGGLMDFTAEGLASANPSDFFQSQRVLRGLLAYLPGVIERRKIEIAEMAPRIRAECHNAIATLSARNKASVVSI
jgi:hypothetical protein